MEPPRPGERGGTAETRTQKSCLLRAAGDVGPADSPGKQHSGQQAANTSKAANHKTKVLNCGDAEKLAVGCCWLFSARAAKTCRRGAHGGDISSRASCAPAAPATITARILLAADFPATCHVSAAEKVQVRAAYLTIRTRADRVGGES